MRKTALPILTVILIMVATGCNLWSNDEKQENTVKETEETSVKAGVPFNAGDLNFKEEVEKITKSDDEDLVAASAKKARDSQRIVDLQGIEVQMETYRLINDTIPSTSCTKDMNAEIVGDIRGIVPSDPNKNGLDAKLTGGFDCTDSYFYSSNVNGAVYGLYTKLETPIGNIDCDKVGTSEINKEGGLYCYAIIVEDPESHATSGGGTLRQSNCERTGGTFHVDTNKCDCPKGVLSDMYDPKTGYCKLDDGSTGGELGREMIEEFNRRTEMGN